MRAVTPRGLGIGDWESTRVPVGGGESARPLVVLIPALRLQGEAAHRPWRRLPAAGLAEDSLTPSPLSHSVG